VIAAGFIAAVSGVLIGIVGLGGVLVVPLLTELVAIPVREAVATAMFGFLASGAAAWSDPEVRRGMSRGSLLWLCLPAAGSALAGAYALAHVPTTAIRLAVAAIALASGLFALSAGIAHRGAAPRLWASAGAGAAVGFGSALTGTSGPVLLVPLFMLLRVSLPSAIAYGQVVQVPIAFSASAVNLAAGRLTPLLCASVAGGLLLGTLLGRLTARRVAVASLRRAVAVALIATGLYYGISSLL
jgi:uncharacterized membrane protein YfcA